MNNDNKPQRSKAPGGRVLRIAGVLLVVKCGFWGYFSIGLLGNLAVFFFAAFGVVSLFVVGIFGIIYSNNISKSTLLRLLGSCLLVFVLICFAVPLMFIAHYGGALVLIFLAMLVSPIALYIYGAHKNLKKKVETDQCNETPDRQG
ncbi:MAG: hypothetical protein FWE19_05495 [Oscillospiraceae bacterium]|nr:hypothetical protein [Oscillospiraceae bacterium]